MMDGTTSPLRQRMIEDMTVRGFTTGTQRSYIRAVRGFSLFLGGSPDGAEAEDLRPYQLHMCGQGASAGTMNATVSALRFLFSVTLEGRVTADNDTLTRLPGNSALNDVAAVEIGDALTLGVPA